MIDQESLNELRGMVGDKFDVIVQSYLNNGQDFMAKIKAAIAADDKVAIRKAAHAFRSASAQMGALKLEELLGGLEEMDAGNNIHSYQQIFINVESEYNAAQTALKKIIA